MPEQTRIKHFYSPHDMHNHYKFDNPSQFFFVSLCGLWIVNQEDADKNAALCAECRESMQEINMLIALDVDWI